MSIDGDVVDRDGLREERDEMGPTVVDREEILMVIEVGVSDRLLSRLG